MKVAVVTSGDTWRVGKGRGEKRGEERGGEERGGEKRREEGEQRETEGEAGLKFRIVGGTGWQINKKKRTCCASETSLGG